MFLGLVQKRFIGALTQRLDMIERLFLLGQGPKDFHNLGRDLSSKTGCVGFLSFFIPRLITLSDFNGSIINSSFVHVLIIYKTREKNDRGDQVF